VVYRKAIGHVEQRIAKSAKILSLTLALMALHGFVATYLYTNYLRNEIDAAPLSLTVLIWTILGAITALVSYRLIELANKLKTMDAVVDAIFYAVVFGSVTVSVSPKIGSNAALILSLLAIMVCVVPFSRFFISCKQVKFNRRGLKRKPGRSILYTLVSLPTLVPLFAILYVVEFLSPDLTLFLFNAVSITLVVYISFAMLTRMNNALEGEVNEAPEAGAAATAAATNQASGANAAPAMDPLVAELLAEEEASRKEQNTDPAPQPGAPDVVPPAKPAQPSAKKEQPKAPPKPKPQKPQAPKKPQPKSDDQAAQGSTLKVKPPTKPKKRF
jgi:pyruvate/2-oxoglutarate dehydrogenase complex dihydrolipoamide acyltransferase (E2) component